MSAIEIMSHVPIPEVVIKKRIYPFRRMRVGDSFRLPITEASRVRSAVSVHNKRYPNTKFVTRNIHDREIGVWRIQ